MNNPELARLVATIYVVFQENGYKPDLERIIKLTKEVLETEEGKNV